MRNTEEIEYAYMWYMRIWNKANLDSVPYTEQEQSATSSKECVCVRFREDRIIYDIIIKVTNKLVSFRIV